MPLGSFRLNTLSRTVGEIIQLISQIFSSGASTQGELGLPFVIGSSESLINISNLGNLAQTFQKISARTDHSLAITTTGELYSWGSNAGGKTGLSITAGSTTTPTILNIADKSWAEVSAGNNHSLAVTTTGELYSWGFNQNGQTGLNLTTGSTIVPTQVGTATNWAQVSAGTGYSVAITTTGELWAWGLNTSGQLGRGNTTSPQTTPLRIGTATNWARVSAGTNHSVAITTTGELWAWGNNTSGQLGRGNTTSPQTSPIRIGTATNWARVSAGTAYSVAITTTGQLWAWGNNTNGQLGRGNTTSPQTSPIQIGTATNWAQVSAGNDHSLAVTTTGQLWAWGLNTSGQLGRGNFTSPQTTPIQIGTATNWAQVSAGTNYSIAINSLGQLWASGTNLNSPLGLPAQISEFLLLENLNIAKISAGDNYSLAVTTTGQLWAWGLNSSGQLGRGNTTSPQRTPVRIGTATNWAQVSAGRLHSLAVTTNGELWAWGDNSSGQLGRGNTTGPQTSPIRIGSATNWTQVSTGTNHSMAINSLGELWAWGNNLSGQLGRGNTTSPQTTPIRVATFASWAQVSAGINFSVSLGHTLAITTTGQLWAWGNNGSTQLGDGTSTQRNSPVRIGTATNWAQVNTGELHTLAVTTTGELYSWGVNQNGRTGLGISTGNASVPTQVGTDTNWANVSASFEHSLAITTTGELWAWGNNLNGRTGLGLLSGSTIVPSRVGTATNWVEISAGELHSLARKQ
jgi:alpha-tubulin suppressor-like RCC1 family protein